jgi:redox-sensitive bicupin YhaK (pirin superfamily)
MLDTVIDQRRRDLGGFEVGRVLPHPKRHMVGPFIFLDHMGPVTFARGIGRDVDVRPHPHIGLSTVTYLFEGEIVHRDSVGSEQAIRPAEVNWMIAGRGITHSERFEKARAEGGAMHGLQAWVALPDGSEEVEPSFTHYGARDLPVLEDKGITIRIIAGEAFGGKSKVKTHSPMFYAHLELARGAAAEVPEGFDERAAYVVSGSVQTDNESFGAGQLLLFRRSEPASLKAEDKTTLMLLGGDSVGQRFIEWNFVSSSRERIEQAKADWRAGRMKLPDLDNREFIALPPDPPSPGPPVSRKPRTAASQTHKPQA